MIHAGNAITVQMLSDGIAEFLTYKVSRSTNLTVQRLKISKLQLTLLKQTVTSKA
jgi:hypothetical protein